MITLQKIQKITEYKFMRNSNHKSLVLHHLQSLDLALSNHTCHSLKICSKAHDFPVNLSEFYWIRSLLVPHVHDRVSATNCQ